MNDKDKSLFNRSSFRRSMDPSDPIINPYSSSMINEPIDLFAHSISSQTNPATVTNRGRKRLITEDGLIEESNKRKKIQSENQPPRATIKRRSLFLYHPKYDWNPFPIDNHLPSSVSPSFNPLFPSLASSQFFAPQYSQPPCHFHSELHYSNLFTNQSSMKNIHPTTTMDGSSPLRTTNFVRDSKQQHMSATVMRTGNVSPAHSDTSIESTSTCSSDEAHFHSNFSTLHSQPSRSSRERENYEQLLDLAEKLADPDRLEKIDIEQFFSYRYKSIITTNDILSSKQTACVICMSPFKNGQRIRVLPCQHEYHNKCIARWLKMNSSCPICRRGSLPSNC